MLYIIIMTLIYHPHVRDYLRADEQKGMLIVVDCYTEWCGPCKMIYPVSLNSWSVYNIKRLAI